MAADVVRLPDRGGLAAALEHAIRAAVADAIANDHAAPEQPAARGRRMVDRAGAADYLGVSPSTIDTWARAGRITRRRFGGVVRYDVADLDRFADGWERS